MNGRPRSFSSFDSLRVRGFAPETCAADKGYDYGPFHEGCMERGVLPVTAERKSAKGPAVPPARVRARNVDVAGAEFKRRATKWGCPTGECKPASTWIEADRRNPLVPGSTRRFRDLYAGRAAVEREFGRLKHEYGLTPLRIRGLARVSVPLAA